MTTTTDGDGDDGKKTSLESHFHLSKSRVNDAVSTLEKTILETAKKRERELSEKKTLIDRLYERLELTREMVGDIISHALTHCVFVAYTHIISSNNSARTTIAAVF